MRFVDEYRDADKARALSARIAGFCEPGRVYRLMEVCGGHTHTIYKHGLEDYLPENITLVHGPGCPVCVIPMGRVDDAIAIAEQPDVILASFGDMMRVPGGRGSFFDATAAGADIRMVYSPLDALKVARANPGKRVVFLGIGFETTAPSTAMTVLRAKAAGIENFSVFCNHVTVLPAIQAILDSPDMRLDGFLGPGHVSTVIGCRPYEFIAREYGRPLVVSGFEPLDLLASIAMLVEQLHDGRCEIENQYTRVVGWDGNLRALAVIAEVMELARPSSGAAWAPSRTPPGHAGGIRRLRRRACLRSSGGACGRPGGLPVRRGAQGRHRALGVQGVRHRMHARDADRDVHGLQRGRLRGVLQLRSVHPEAGARGGDALAVDTGARKWLFEVAGHDTISMSRGPIDTARASATGAGIRGP